MTRDIDIVIELQGSDAGRFAALFADDFYCEAEAVRRAVTGRGMFNIIHGTGLPKVDFIIRKDTEYRRLEFSRRRATSIHGKDIWIVSPEDLLLSKLIWAQHGESYRQLDDARNLLAYESERLDWAYVEQWATQLGVTGLLAEVRR